MVWCLFHLSLFSTVIGILPVKRLTSIPMIIPQNTSVTTISSLVDLQRISPAIILMIYPWIFTPRGGFHGNKSTSFQLISGFGHAVLLCNIVQGMIFIVVGIRRNASLTIGFSIMLTIVSMLMMSSSPLSRHSSTSSQTKSSFTAHLVNNDRCDCPEDEDGLCNDEDSHIRHSQKRIAFTVVCDGFTDLLPTMIDGQMFTDESECHFWPCTNIGSIILIIQAGVV